MAKLHLAQQILDIIWPVGSIYLSDNTTNPNTKFGGTWTRLSGGFIYGSTVTTANTNTYSTGNIGSGVNTNAHTLTIDEMPSHSHAQKVTANPNTGGIGIRKDWDEDANGLSQYPQGIDTYSTGGGKGHGHAIPYIACSIWRRTA